MHFDNLLLRMLCISYLALSVQLVGAQLEYAAVPRWGQAAALVNNTLFIHGGKTDVSNSYSYSSAPTSSDLLYLPLSAPFDPSSPPWRCVSNSTTDPGPTLAWHTLSAFNTSTLLLFGGDPGPNSATVIMDLADSAVFLNVFDSLNPVWITEPQSWANEPMRRIHHSASSTGGKIWLVGGEKDDGSTIGFSDHFVFDPNGPSFTPLPSTNGPSDLYGHASIVLPNGLMLIFGGYSQSMGILIPFTTIWAIDTTQSNLAWTSLSVSNSSLPLPRRAFAAVLLDDGKILIQGGADAAMQSVFSDGWTLDTTQNPMVWTQVGGLSELGPRFDHFAVVAGSQVIFGWGFGSNGAADTTLHIYNPSGNSFVSSFTPSSVPPPATLPVPFQTQTGTNPSGTSRQGSGTSTGSMGAGSGSTSSRAGTRTGSVNPTSTQGGPNPNNPNPGVSASGSRKPTAAIAVGTVFGLLALMAGLLATGYYIKQYRRYPASTRGNRFHPLDGTGSDDGDGALMANVIPTAGVRGEKTRNRRPSGWLSGNKREINIQTGAEDTLNDTGAHRRDMFADEDTREFGGGPLYNVGRDASGDSSWSLPSMGIAIGSIGAGVRGILSRQNSESIGSVEASDPFLGGDRATVRSHDRLQTSWGNTIVPYRDPSTDNPVDDATGSDEGDADETTRLTNTNPMSSRTVQPFTPGLAPLTEQVSRTSEPTTSSSSHAVSSGPFDSNPSSSATSYEYKPQRRSSIINSTSDAPIRRSDSWWARFSRTSFLDRKSPERPSKALDIRDPNPAPRLVTIQEASSHSNSSGSPESQAQRNNSGPKHNKSVSSLRTTKTADSDAIERMGGMDVIQRAGTHGSHQTIPSIGHDSLDHEPSWTKLRPLPPIPSSVLGGSQSQTDNKGIFESPVDMTQLELSQLNSVSDRLAQSTQESSAHQPIPHNSNVLGRVLAYERRMSQDEDGVPGSGPPIRPDVRNTKKREEHPSKTRVTINYGLAPRPSLFVANPDDRGNHSSES